MSNQRFLSVVIVALLSVLMLAAGRGPVFAAPHERVIWSFGGPGDGVQPDAALLKVGNSLYGTTVSGGANNSGAVFQLTPPPSGQSNWSENVLWSFGDPGDGAQPEANLIAIGGKLYGTTAYGGAYSYQVRQNVFLTCGTAFELTPPAPGQTAWSEQVIWSFGRGGVDCGPFGGLIEAGAKLYGTTADGEDLGTVFQLTPPTAGQTAWSENVLWSFSGGLGDGAFPYDGLIDVGGKLYGTTIEGGANAGNELSSGTVFQLTPPASGDTNWNEQVLWSFGVGPDASAGPQDSLIAAGGKLYGTTADGGANSCPFASGCGTVFQLTPPAPGQTNWSENVLWSFGGPGDGANPSSSLLAMDGKLYGTTPYGGANACTGPGSGCGAAFQLTPPAPGQTNWTEKVLWSFGSGADGASPSGLIRVGGALYGTTASGGSNNAGTVFAIAP